MKTINESWQEFRNDQLPSNASDTRIKDCRQAFFAGALSLLNILDELARADVSEEENSKLLDEIHSQLIDFELHGQEDQ